MPPPGAAGKPRPAGMAAKERPTLARTRTGPLFAVYNRIMGEKNRGELTFPFDMGKLKKNELEQIEEWTNGLYCAMYLRPDIWGMDRDEEEISEEEEEILTSCGVIMGIAMPEEIPNIFESEKKLTTARR